MGISQEQLDTDLKAEAQAEADLGTLITSEVAALAAALAKQGVDLTNEDSQVVQSINTLKGFGTQLQQSTAPTAST